MKEEKKFERVEVTIDDKICFVVMNNPEKLNCLDDKMCNDIVQAINYGYNNECVSNRHQG